MSKSEPQNDSLQAAWIAKKVRAMLSHYPSDWSMDEGVAEMALDDWVKFLIPYPRAAIEFACSSYLRDQPRMRPTPGAIRSRAQSFRQENGVKVKGGDKSELTSDELHLLENTILPRARKWVSEDPGLADFGRQTLAYWGEQS